MSLVAVRLESGLVVWHTREEYARLVRGVDLEAARKATGELQRDNK